MKKTDMTETQGKNWRVLKSEPTHYETPSLSFEITQNSVERK
jgi:hypothetical protein